MPSRALLWAVLLFPFVILMADGTQKPVFHSLEQDQQKMSTQASVQNQDCMPSATLSESENQVTSDYILKIVRDGQIWHHQVALQDDWAVILDVSAPSVLDLDADGECEVILEVFSSGAYCCAFNQIYHYDASDKSYHSIEYFWVNYRNIPLLADVDQDGQIELVTHNEHFSSGFAPHAISAPRPIQIWHYKGGQMREVTRLFPDLIRSDSESWWQWYDEHKEDVWTTRVALAAYLADKQLLGEGKEGWQNIRQVYQQEDREPYFERLQEALEEHGYAPKKRHGDFRGRRYYPF